MADSTENTSEVNTRDAVREAAISAVREGMEAYTAKERAEAAEEVAEAESMAPVAAGQNEVRSETAVAAAEQAENVGENDQTKNDIRMRLPQYEDDYALREAFKSLRSNIEFAGEDKVVLAITSCVRDEGKSFVSMNLAMTLAESGRKVLFVDGDLRKSVTIGRYRIKGKKEGLSNFLASQTNLDNVLVHTNLRGLDIILAGHVPPNPSELLGTARFKLVLSKFRDIYDYVIIDTPPLGSVIDSAIIAQNCDGVALVMEARAISRKFAEKVVDQIRKTGCPILGVILNKVEIGGKIGKYYGKYYGRYYGKYYGKYYGEYYGKSN